MSDLSIIQGRTLTMSSREIADLVDVRHDNVRRTIETIAAKGIFPLPQIEEKATGGRPSLEYHLDKRSSLIVVAQLCPEFTARIVDRWQELEKMVTQPAIPQTLPEALRLAADLAEQKAQAEARLAIAAPKADALDRIAAGDENVTMTQAAKILGIKRETLTQWMHANGLIYRQNGSWVAYDQHIRNGRLAYKEAKYTDDTTGQEVHRPYCHITPKGLTWLAEHGPGRLAA